MTSRLGCRCADVWSTPDVQLPTWSTPDTRILARSDEVLLLILDGHYGVLEAQKGVNLRLRLRNRDFCWFVQTEIQGNLEERKTDWKNGLEFQPSSTPRGGAHNRGAITGTQRGAITGTPGYAVDLCLHIKPHYDPQPCHTSDEPFHTSDSDHRGSLTRTTALNCTFFSLTSCSGGLCSGSIENIRASCAAFFFCCNFC